MEEENAIKFATLHLMGKAHDWWFHRVTTLGHGHITSYRISLRDSLIGLTGRILSFISKSSRRKANMVYIRILLNIFKGWQLRFHICRSIPFIDDIYRGTK
jgi:hypothetical protein